MFFNKYPYTDFHEMNLDWLLNKMRELEIEFDEFKVVNNITFSGQWDITKQYPAWTIVSDNNIGYVSQKPVPVGVPLNNGNYWVEVIDYTAQIAGLEQRVINLENIVGDNNSGLVHDVDVLEDDVDYIEKGLNPDTIALISDSYGLDNVCGGKSWQTFLEEMMPDKTFIKYAFGGAGFGWDQSSQYYMPTLLTSIPVNTNVRLVIIGMGANDGNLLHNQTRTEQNIIDGITASMPILKNRFPNAKIKLGFIGRYKDAAHNLYYDRACRVYQNNSYQGYDYIHNAQHILHNRWFIDDKDIHPSIDGSRRLATYLMNTVNGNDFDVHEAYSGTYNNMQYAAFMHNDQFKLLINGTGSTYNTVTVGDTVLPMIMKEVFDNNINWFRPTEFVCSNSFPSMIGTNGQTYDKTCEVLFGDTKMYIILSGCGADGSTAASLINVVLLPNYMSFECPSSLC